MNKNPPAENNTKHGVPNACPYVLLGASRNAPACNDAIF
jgi:hypothetical protein